MKIIGVGWNKTGTASLTVALNRLGYRCKHNPRQRRIQRILRGDCMGFDACCDYPVWERWRELYTVYPDAKFILTVRDLESWIRSRRAHVWRNSRNGRRRWVAINEAADRAEYTVHNAEVCEFFAGSPNFLELRICDGQGWPELCRFLDKPIPTEPFPHRNKTWHFAPEPV